jgi:hypothetical protein
MLIFHSCDFQFISTVTINSYTVHVLTMYCGYIFSTRIRTYISTQRYPLHFHIIPCHKTTNLSYLGANFSSPSSQNSAYCVISHHATSTARSRFSSTCPPRLRPHALKRMLITRRQITAVYWMYPIIVHFKLFSE